MSIRFTRRAIDFGVPAPHRDPTRRKGDVFASLPKFPDPEKRFKGLPLRVAYYSGSDWVVEPPISYRTKSGATSTVRRGFRYDFGSIPRFVWRVLFPPTGDRGNPAGIAFTFHDWLYCHQQMDGVPITRAVADSIMREILLYTGCSRWKANVVYAGVCLGGWVPWRKHGRTNEENDHADASDRDGGGSVGGGSPDHDGDGARRSDDAGASRGSDGPGGSVAGAGACDPHP